ncbi:hypothetical protein FRB97_007116 [Tulasnella sp. 331]|nr:hypothetical protein FRB97_007116 [Tulasnella sp. 331]KAG8888485.1 hypothetical protein FRB98_007614 [Tulasnella sp. 332]
MPPRGKAKDVMPDPQIFKATYSGVPVYEMICKGVALMRRRSDGWLNATQILKVAGFDKPQRTRVLEREVQKGEHEKVQGGYGKYQGTWVPLERGISLAKQYNVSAIIQPIVEFVPATNSPPLAPKHVTQPSHRPKRPTAGAEGGAMATRSAKRPVVDEDVIPLAALDEDGEEDAIGEPDEDPSDMVAPSHVSSPRGTEDGSMTSSPSDASSSSQTPSPIASSLEGSGNDSNDRQQEKMDWVGQPSLLTDMGSRGKTGRRSNGDGLSNGPLASTSYGPTSSQPQPLYNAQVGGSFLPPHRMGEPPADSRRYGDVILEYFISDTTQIPAILISPPPDFDPNMAIDDDGHTALHWACAMGRVRVVKLLLTAGADIFKVNKGGQTPLMRSVMFSNNYDVRKFPELYELLHRSTLNIDNFNRTVFHHVVDLAMSKGKTHAARYYMETLLNRLADFPQELADIINFQDEDGETALTLAARCRSKRLVKLLIDHGADPKLRNSDQKSTEDYILEDERFRYSPVLRGQPLSFRVQPGSSQGGLGGAFGPRLHHSMAAQQASGKCPQDMAMMLDSLASSFDQELSDKERDLTQAHALLSNIQAEILESQRAVAALKTQAAALTPERCQLERLEGELRNKMEKRFRLGWERWIQEEDARGKAWMHSFDAPTTINGAGPVVAGGTVTMSNSSPPERRTRAGANTTGNSTTDYADLDGFHNYASALTSQSGLELIEASESLKGDISIMKTRRREVFDRFIRLSAEAGTGGKMAEYRRLIGAGCGGVPPDEVDNVIGVLLETLEADEGSMAYSSTAMDGIVGSVIAADVISAGVPHLDG